MGIWTREPKMAADDGAAQGSSWTNGREIGAKLTTALLVGAIICGPAALFVAWNVSSKPAAIAAAVSQGGLTAEQQATGSYALGYVVAWLGASRENPGQLTDYVDLASVRDISEQAWEYRDATVVSIIPGATGDVVSVQIAANVKEQGVSADGDATTETWPRRYFQVAVKLDGGSVRVIGMPTPVAGPGTADAAPLVYSVSLGSNEPAAETAVAFLGAYLADSGEIARYITPGTALTAIKPAPYVQITATDIRADRRPSAAPADGDTATLLVTVTLANAYEQRLSATYALTLTARANRWEVSSLDLAPQEAASTEAGTTPTPAPTGADDSEGN